MPDMTKIATNKPTTIPTTLDDSACCFSFELVGEFAFVADEDSEVLMLPVLEKRSDRDLVFVEDEGSDISRVPVLVELSVGDLVFVIDEDGGDVSRLLVKLPVGDVSGCVEEAVVR